MYSVEELTGNNLINSSNLGNGLLHDFEQDSLLDNFKEAVKDKKFKLHLDFFKNEVSFI